MRYRWVALALVLAAACTNEPASVQGPTPPATSTPSPSPTITPAPSPTATPAVRFSAARATQTIRALVTRAPRREAASRNYRVAADIMATGFERLGYTVRRQRFDVPAGSVDRVAVPAGTSENVVATPRGFDRAKPHLVVGGHLDSVPDTPGANDNASGMGVMLELARLASIEAPRIQIVWVAFGAEERRTGPGLNAYSLGAREYLRRMTVAERGAMEGMLNIDMVGAGSTVKIIGGRGAMVAALLAAARAERVPREHHTSISQGFSDHQQFQQAGFSVGWLWAGDHVSLHEPSDDMDVIQQAELGRVGRVAWQMLRTFPG